MFFVFSSGTTDFAISLKDVSPSGVNNTIAQTMGKRNNYEVYGSVKN